MIPNNLEECYKYLDTIDNVNTWLKLSENSAIIDAHSSVGRWIRNKWGFWTGEGELFNWFKSNDINHPDDMSSIILRSYHRFKNNKEIKLNEQFEHTIEFYLNDKEKLLRKRKLKLNKIEDDI